MRFKADYKDVPGAGKNRVKPREADDALWMHLNVQSLTPDLDESSSSHGLVAGSGIQLVDTFSAPMTQGASPQGTGRMTARLHHADRLTSSLTVVVKVPDHAKAARARTEAMKFITSTVQTFGDVDQLEARAVAHLAERGIAGAQVSIHRNTKVTKDLGESSFHYRVRGPSQVLLDIEAVDAGQSEPTTYQVTKDAGEATETETERRNEQSRDHTKVTDSKRVSERHHEQSSENTDVTYNKRVVETLTDIVEQVGLLRNEFVEHVTDDLTKRSKFNEVKKVEKDWGDRSVGHSNSTKTGHKESGEKDRRNIANDIQDVTGTIKDVFSLPGLDKFKYVRRLTPWWLLVEGVDLVAGKFKAKGKVNVEDTKETIETDENQEKSGHANDTERRNGDRTDTEKRRSSVRRKVDQASQSLWSNFKRRVETTSEVYRSRATKDSAGGSNLDESSSHESTNEKSLEGGVDRVKEENRSGSTVTISASTVTKYTRPVVKPTVVEGDCDVSTQPFSVEKKRGG